MEKNGGKINKKEDLHFRFFPLMLCCFQIFFNNAFASFRVWKHWNPSCDSLGTFVQLSSVGEALHITWAILEQNPNPNHKTRQSHMSTALPSTRFSFLKDLILCTGQILRKCAVWDNNCRTEYHTGREHALFLPFTFSHHIY